MFYTRFEIEQHQLKFNLQSGLCLEASDWLSTAVFLKSESCNRKMLKYEDYTIALHPAEANTILIRDSKSKELLQKSFLHAENSIQDIQVWIVLHSVYVQYVTIFLKIHAGRLSALFGESKVIVYDFDELLNGASSRTTTLFIHEEETAPIHYHYLRSVPNTFTSKFKYHFVKV